MEKIKKSWTDFKTLISSKCLPMQYIVDGSYYKIWADEDNDTYLCMIDITDPAGTDQEDFEDNYKDDCNKGTALRNPDGTPQVISSSRPRGTSTVFTMTGDSPTVIGAGDDTMWDFSNSDDIVTDSLTTTIPANYKRKRKKISFLDPVWIKEGAIYFFDAPKGCYIDFWVVCPSGEYYKKNDGTPVLASQDTPIAHYVIHHHIAGEAPMGDELNAEAATFDPIPTNYELWLEITTPDTDESSYGHVSVEMYRERSVVLE